MGFVYALMVAMAVAVAVASASKVPHGYYCSEPQAPKHGQVRGDGDFHYFPGQVIYYSCDHGYQLHGHSESQCDYDTSSYQADWRYPAPVCKGKLVATAGTADHARTHFST